MPEAERGAVSVIVHFREVAFTYNSTRYHNIGSIYIPCEAPKGKKNICTLYRYAILFISLKNSEY